LKRIVAGVAITLLMISTLFYAFSTQPAEADFRRNGAEGYFSVDNTQLLHSTANHNRKGNSKQVRVFDHRSTTLESETLKKEIGVCEESGNYSQIIDGHGTGLCPPTEEEWAEIADDVWFVDKILLDESIQSPSNIDHSMKPWFPPIGNQDGEGSCVAWAIGYYMKTFQEAQEHGWDLTGAIWEGGYFGYPSVEYQDRIFSPDFIYHLINNGEDEGSSYFNAISLVCFIGASSWEKMPYDPGDHTSWPSEEAWREAPLYRGNSSMYESIWFDTDDDLISLKNWLASDHLAVISIDAGKYSYLTSGDFWTLDNYVNPRTNHANTIVGYDDNIEYLEEGQLRQGAFKIANSWGEGGWENIPDGYYWVSYETMKQRVRYCMFYRDMIGYEPELVASFKLDHSKRAECYLTIGMGNESSPVRTKTFNVYGGYHPFCPNDIVFDITEFTDDVSSVVAQSFFLRVYDGGSATTGTINSFSIEYYLNYMSGALDTRLTSRDVPIATVGSNYVFAWARALIVPDDYPTIQQAINNAYDWDAVFVRAGIYNESPRFDMSPSTAVSLIGESPLNTTVTGTVRCTYHPNAAVMNLEILEELIVGSGLGPSYGIRINNNIIRSGVYFQAGNSEVKNSLIEGGLTILGGYHEPVSENIIVNNTFLDSGVRLDGLNGGTSNNTLKNNTIINASIGIWEDGNGIPTGPECYRNFIIANRIIQCEIGVKVSKSSQQNPLSLSVVSSNTLERNNYGILLESVTNVSISHNNFINNTIQTYINQSYNNFWDNGYEGNYWSEYNGTDTNEDGIGDTDLPWQEVDYYPLMNPFRGHNIAVLNIELNKTIIGRGPIQKIDVEVTNLGSFPQTFSVTVYINTTVTQTQLVTLAVGNSTILRFYLDTTDFAYGNYTISAYAAPVPDETDTDNNTYINGMVLLTIAGDVDGDRDVDMFDFGTFAYHYATVTGDPRYLPEADFDNDGDVDMFDFGTLAANYGSSI